MANALSVSRLVSVQTIFSPVAAGRRGFGTLLFLGDSAVIGPSERLRAYTTLEAVAQDFGVTAPEYYGASLYFGQSPRPKQLMIGRWLSSAVPAQLTGAILTAAQQTLANWTAITDGYAKADKVYEEKMGKFGNMGGLGGLL